MEELGGRMAVILPIPLSRQKADHVFFPGCYSRHALTRASHCGYHTPFRRLADSPVRLSYLNRQVLAEVRHVVGNDTGIFELPVW
jgi:hypothetical protein